VLEFLPKEPKNLRLSSSNPRNLERNQTSSALVTQSNPLEVFLLEMKNNQVS
jgi:hypothetical protein